MSDSTNDPIRPTHYTRGGLEVIDAIEAWGLDSNFLLGNVIKYVARAGHKGPAVICLRKARWYLDRAIKNLEKAEDEAEAEDETPPPASAFLPVAKAMVAPCSACGHAIGAHVEHGCRVGGCNCQGYQVQLAPVTP